MNPEDYDTGWSANRPVRAGRIVTWFRKWRLNRLHTARRAAIVRLGHGVRAEEFDKLKRRLAWCDEQIARLERLL